MVELLGLVCCLEEWHYLKAFAFAQLVCRQGGVGVVFLVFQLAFGVALTHQVQLACACLEASLAGY